MFDETYENKRLTMLAKQHPSAVKVAGTVTFAAEDTADRLVSASWSLERDIFDYLNESGFKPQLMELLDNFIEYRGACNKLPKKEGRVRFGDGLINIEWLT